MPRPHRHDGPDTWHHLLNRGLTKRTIFENARDCRFFLALLAREVRAGRLEVHAYCLMLNHFHLLVRSVTGELSVAMRRIQNRYSRYFNRTRKRDGPLFRGRFRSRWIHSYRYRRNVLAYIHDNPRKAGLCAARGDYRWSSAGALRRGAPRWLAQDWVAAELAAKGFGSLDEASLEAAFPGSLDEAHQRWVEAQLRDRHEEETEDETLKHVASARTVRWAIRKARAADGTRPWRPVCPANTVERVLALAERSMRSVRRILAAGGARVRAQLWAGLLRMLSGCTHREIARRTGRHRGTVAHDLADHRERLAAYPSYARLTARVARAALAAMGV